MITNKKFAFLSGYVSTVTKNKLGNYVFRKEYFWGIQKTGEEFANRIF